uniref:FBD domain-containing protein n=2 Tax=Aegilops tauschii subsp. strangulata TaxID=200361 RepID=A0A453NAU0_AEGTS
KVLAPVLAELRFVNLDHLPEDCDISWTMFLLESAPYLEELCITVWDHKCRSESQKSFSKKMDVKWGPSDPHFRHKNLGRLIIHGFQSDGNFTGYVRRVIQAAVNIREVSLHDRKVCQWCVEKFPHLRFRPSSYPRTREDADLLRKKMTAETATASPDIHFCS